MQLLHEISLSLRHAVRRLRASPGFTATAVATLTVGLAAVATVFSIANGILLRPLPYPQSEQLVSVSHTLQVGGTLRVGQTDASLLFYPRHSRVFLQFGGYQAAAAALGPSGGADAERVPAARVTAPLFDALRVTPIAGRLFSDADAQPAAAPVAIVAERLWARRFGRDPSLLNRRIVIDGQPREIVGILPDRVRFPLQTTELWLPLVLDPAKTDSASYDYEAIARLRSGVTAEQAATDLDALLPELPDEFPGRLTRGAIAQTHMHVEVRPLADVLVEGLSTMLWVVLGAAVFVLAAACANVACLFLVRADHRRRMFAVQRVLGAPARTILFEFLSEAVIVAAAAGGLAVAAAFAATRWIRASPIALQVPRLTEVTTDSVVLAAAAVATALTTVAIAGFGVWRAYRSAAGSAASWGPAVTIDRGQHHARYTLVAVQVAVAMLLVVGAGLMARSLRELRRVQPGFDRNGALTFRLALPPSRYPTTGDAVRFFVRAVDAASHVAGASTAGAASKLPLEQSSASVQAGDSDQTQTAVFVETRPLAPGALPRIHPVAYVTPGYFDAMRIPILDGGRFTTPDPPAVRLDAIVSRAFAERYWPGESPIGKRLRLLINGPWYTVVGVAGNVHDASLERAADEIVYCPILPPDADRRWVPRDLAFVVRSAGDPAAIAGPVRDAVRRLDPSLPLYRTRTLSDVVAQASARRELVLLLVASASVIAILLGAIGLYGVMAYVVSLRTREIGIRIALGGPPSHVGWIVVKHGIAAAVVGAGAGLTAAAFVAKRFGSLLFHVAPSDPTVLAASAAAVLALAAAASWIPGRRAAAVNPAIALRAE